MALRTLVIVNPASGNGATGRRWSDLETRLRSLLGPIEVERTRGPRDAERLVVEGARAGLERIVVAGGDGTLGEAATGLLSQGLGAVTQLGLLPLGTGGDFARTLGIPRDIEAAIECIASGRPRVVDAGRATFGAREGGRRTAWFANMASFGISGLVDDLVNRTTKVFGGTVSFLVGTLRALALYRAAPVAIRVDGVLVHEGPLMFATAANGRAFGGGMWVAPDAEVDDGLLDVVVVPRLPVASLVSKLPKLYRGTHVADPAVTVCRGAVVEAESVSGSPLVELDGDALGVLPARFEVEPAALRILVPGK